MGINGEDWEETVLGDGVGRRKGGAEASGLVASSSFAEGMGEFVLRSMDARFSGSVDDDEYVSSRQPGTSPDCLCLVPPFRWACDF